MSSAQQDSKLDRRSPARWPWYLALAVVVLGLYGIDRYLKSTDVAGVLPASATWRIEASDLPGAWARWQESPSYTSLRASAPGALQAVAVSLRKMTGVRPTPARLKLWLGEQVLIGGDTDGWCLSLRPGLALRAVTVLARPPFEGHGDVEPFWQSYASGWHEGFFLVASSEEYLARVLAEGTPVPPSGLGGEVLSCGWEGENAGTLELRVEDGLPLSLHLPDTPPLPEVAAPAPGGWEDATGWAAFHGDAVPALAARAGRAIVESEALSPAWELWAPLVHTWWNAYCPLELGRPEGDPWALGIFETDFRAEIPTMELVLAEGGSRGTIWSPAAVQSAPVHRWNDTEGRLIPVPGDVRAWSAAEAKGLRFLTSAERLMPQALEGGLAPEPGVAAVGELAWQPFAGALVALARRAGKEALIPGMDRDDVSRDIVPLLESLQSWGRLQLRVEASGTGLRGEGYLAYGAGGP